MYLYKELSDYRDLRISYLIEYICCVLHNTTLLERIYLFFNYKE